RTSRGAYPARQRTRLSGYALARRLRHVDPIQPPPRAGLRPRARGCAGRARERSRTRSERYRTVPWEAVASQIQKKCRPWRKLLRGLIRLGARSHALLVAHCRQGSVCGVLEDTLGRRFEQIEFML